MVKKRTAETAHFKQQEKYSPRNGKEKFLISKLTEVRNPEIMAALLRDLCTLPEITELSNRLEMASLIASGHSYQEVADLMNVSTTTVSRVAHWLYNGCGGYYKLLFKK